MPIEGVVQLRSHSIPLTTWCPLLFRVLETMENYVRVRKIDITKSVLLKGEGKGLLMSAFLFEIYEPVIKSQYNYILYQTCM